MTLFINFIGGPGVGKSTMAAALFVWFKSRGLTTELIWEVGKQYVWTGNKEILNDEHFLAQTQYEIFKQIDGHVRFVITDGSLLNGLWYNRNNPDNVSDLIQTEAYIMEKHAEFTHINIYLHRGSFPFETEGRFFSEIESEKIHKEFREILIEKQIPFVSWTSDLDEVKFIGDYVMNELKNLI
jgi:hypothetical protein